MEKLYAVVSNSDLTEGRGRPVFIAYCKAEATAKRLAKGKGVMGTDADIRMIELVPSSMFSVPLIPVSVINIEYPTKEDEAEQLRRDKFEACLQKAVEAGLTHDEIEALINGYEK